MKICFRPTVKSDCEVLRIDEREWKRLDQRRKWGVSGGPGSVVTLDGLVILALDGDGHVRFQDDRFPIADLIRARMSVIRALEKVYHADLVELKRERRGDTLDAALDRLRNA